MRKYLVCFCATAVVICLLGGDVWSAMLCFVNGVMIAVD
jgi:hypothetical protein